jgi:hypothetical protein
MARSGQVRDRQQRDSARGLALLDNETRGTLGRRRWRQPPLTSPALSLALTLVSVLHVLFALALWYEMRPKPQHLAVVNIDIDQALIVRLIDHSNKPHAAPAPKPLAPPETLVPSRQLLTARVSPVTNEKSRRDAMVVQDHEASPAPAAPVATPSASSLFAKDGSVRLPSTTGATSATESANAESPKPKDDRQIMEHDSNRMHYKATRFEKYFPPPNETAGGALGRHIGDVIKEIAKSTCDPTKSSTASNLLCGAPPPPASPMDGDERLNLPPAPLADNPVPTKAPPLLSCIAEYKEDKPLSSGCPVDTPDLAFRAEMRECIDLFRAGKRLKTWCPVDTPKRAAAESSTSADSSSVGAH